MLNEARCIFCLSSEPPSGFTIEHVFPEAIGGTLTIRSVCKDCNDRLGHSVDSTITSHALVKLRRFTLGIAGKSGRIPNPFEHGVLHDDPSYKVRYQPKPNSTEPTHIYTIPTVRINESNAGKRVLEVRIDASDASQLEQIVNKALVRAGAPPLQSEDIARLERDVVRVDQPRLKIPLSLELNHYRRGLMKIVYELACYWLGDAYLDDPIAGTLRAFTLDTCLPIDSETKYLVRGTMRMGPKEPLMPFWRTERDHLIASAIGIGTSLMIYVSVLGVLESCVRVTDNLGRYSAFQARFISIDPVSGRRRDSTFEEEAARIGTSVEWCDPDAG